jgi:ACS family D-galactonate transporter-like MFS transporter
MKQYDISPTAMGTVYSAFLLAYTLCMIPGGWLIDRRGPRFALLLVGFGSAVFVILTGVIGLTATSVAVAYPAFLGIRFLMGIVSAPLHPAAAKAVGQDIPLLRRSGANGLITGAALLGIATTYVIFSYLINHFGWPVAFMTAGTATALVAGIWGYSISDHPRQEEVPVSTSTKDETPSFETFGAVLRRSKNLLLLTFSYAAVGYFQYLFFYWMHYYFESVLKLDEQTSHYYAAIPPLAMAFGMPLGGWLSDRLMQSFGWYAARTGLVVTAMVASAVFLLVGIRCTEPVWIVTWLSLALGVLGTLEGPFWVTAIEVGGRRGGFSAGVFNTGGNAGGIIAPITTPWISETLGFGWQAGIATGSLVCFVGAILWFWIDAPRIQLSKNSSAPSSSPSSLSLTPATSNI